MRTDIHFTGKETKMFDNGGEQITILDGKMKYRFSTTLKAGGATKAFESFQKLSPKIGDILPAEISEEEKTFQDPKTGKTVTYTDRKVMYFYTDQEEMTKANTNSTSRIPAVVVSIDVEARLKALEDWRASMEQAKEVKKPAVIEPTFPSEKKDDDIPTITLDEVPF